MSITYAVVLQPNTMKPLPQLPVSRPMYLKPVMEYPERNRRHTIPPPPPPKSPRHLPGRSPINKSLRTRGKAPTIQRSVTAPTFVTQPPPPPSEIPFEPDTFTFTVALAPEPELAPAPLQIHKLPKLPEPLYTKGPLPSPPPPPYSAITKRGTLPQEKHSYTHTEIHTLLRSHQQHTLDHLPSIETRLGAWIAANKHHADLLEEAEREAASRTNSCGFKCGNCRYGIDLLEIKSDDFYLSDSDASTIEVHEEKSTSNHADGSDGKPGPLKVAEMKERKSIWDKPSFRGFLVKVGTLKVGS